MPHLKILQKTRERIASAHSPSAAGCSVVTGCMMKNTWIGVGGKTYFFPSSFSYSAPERETGPFPDTLFLLNFGKGCWGAAEFSPAFVVEKFSAPDVSTTRSVLTFVALFIQGAT